MTSAARYDPVEARALLARTPRVLDALLRDLPAAWLDCDEGAATWTPRQVVAHLIHGERTDWIPRARHLLEHGERAAWTPFDMGAHLRAQPRPVAALLDEFAALRRGNLDAFDALDLTPERLARRGRHPEFGAVTLAEHLATWVAHDLSHLVQVERTMANRWREACGPWARYLRVLGAPR